MLVESSLDQIEDRPRITHFGVGKRWPHPGAESVRFDLAQCHRHRSNVVEPSVIAIRIAERVIDVGGGIERSIPSEARSEEHTSELQSLMRTTYAVLCLKKKTRQQLKQRKHSTS